MTFYADCVPLYFVDPVHHAIGLSHSGWRGTVARMGKCTLEAMQRCIWHRRQPMCIAPLDHPSARIVMRVSEDVAVQFDAMRFPGMTSEILIDKGNGKYQLDLVESE